MLVRYRGEECPCGTHLCIVTRLIWAFRISLLLLNSITYMTYLPACVPTDVRMHKAELSLACRVLTNLMDSEPLQAISTLRIYRIQHRFFRFSRLAALHT